MLRLFGLLSFVVGCSASSAVAHPRSEPSEPGGTKAESDAEETVGPALEYGASEALGRYVIRMDYVVGGNPLVGEIHCRMESRDDQRFDLFLTRMVLGERVIEEPVLSERPVHDLKLTARGPSDAHTNPDGFLKDGASVSDSFMFLLPTTPVGPVQVGSTWQATRVLPLGKSVQTHPAVAVSYEVVSLEACPSPTPGRCARYRFSAGTGEQRGEVSDASGGSYHYEFEGGGLFSFERRFVSATSRIEGVVQLDGSPKLTVSGTLSLEHLVEPDA